MKKLKHQYKQSIQSTRHDYLWKVYPNVRSAIFKKFSTQQERSFYFLHRIEYKSYSLKIRVAVLNRFTELGRPLTQVTP
jgi:hypothetical protein